MSRIARYARAEPMAAFAIACAVTALIIIPAAPHALRAASGLLAISAQEALLLSGWAVAAALARRSSKARTGQRTVIPSAGRAVR